MSKLPKKVIGITGNICSGKSVLTSYLKDQGYYIIDGDEVTKQIYLEDETFKEEMIKLFGNQIIKDKQIDKQKVAQIVFNDEEMLTKLNNLIQPFIINKITSKLAKLDGLVFIDGALILEMGLDKHCDRLIYLSTSPNSQLERLMKRNNLSEQQALNRINSQTKLSEDNEIIDYWINNNKDKEELFKEIDKILEIEG